MGVAATLPELSEWTFNCFQNFHVFELNMNQTKIFNKKVILRILFESRPGH